MAAGRQQAWCWGSRHGAGAVAEHSHIASQNKAEIAN